MASQLQGTGSVSQEEIYTKIKEGKQLNDKISYSHPFKTKNESIRLSIGRVWFNNLLPDDYPLVNEPVDKPNMDSIIKKIVKKYPTEKAADIITDLQQEAYKLATVAPNSFKVDDFIIPEDWTEKKKAFIEKYKDVPKEEINIQKFTNEGNKLSAQLVTHLERSGAKIQNFLNAKDKGDPIDDWKTLLVSKGFVLDVEGNLRGPILTGTSEGYDTEQYFDAASQARRNYYYRSIMSSKPGYLARKVIMSNASIVIDSKKQDCGTKKYYEVFVDDKKANFIVGRNIIRGQQIVKVKEPDQVKGKRVKLRSPLYCKAKKGICPTCYGDHYKQVGTKNIGILAGGTVNMVAINSMMKMRHKSSQLDVIDVNFKDLIKKSKDDMAAINKLLDIREKEILAKKECTIIIDKNDYDDSTLIDVGEEFYMPGILNLYVGDVSDNAYISLPFSFSIHLVKPDDFSVSGKTVTLRYARGEKILYQDYYTKDVEPGLIDRILGGALKYIDSPETLVETVYDQLPSADLVHIELIVSNMFRVKGDTSTPCRLKDYKDFEIIGIKKLPYVNSWLTGLSFEDPKKALRLALVEERDNDMNPIENVLLEKFYDQKERFQVDE